MFRETTREIVSAKSSQCSNWSQLLRWNWVFCRHLNLMPLFPRGSVLNCCFLLYLWLACHHLHRTLHQNDGIVFIPLLPPLNAVCFLDLVFWHSHPNLLIFSRSASREELRCILVSKELISTYEQEDNFSKPKQDECRLCPKDENIF